MTDASSTAPLPDDAPALRPDPAGIIVPRKHGQILFEPPPARLPAFPHPEPPQDFLGFSRRDLRHRARAELLVAIQKHALATGASAPSAVAAEIPWIITGHQVEFFHAGVWAKVIAADALARRTGAVAIDLLVDHDTVPQLGFDVPAQRPGGGGGGAAEGDLPQWSRAAVTWGSAPVCAVDGLASPTAEQFHAWDAALAQHGATHVDSLAFLLSALQTPDPSYTIWMSRARARFEAAMDLRVHHVPTSAFCDSASWHFFILYWFAYLHTDHGGLPHQYNSALADYRRAHDIHNDHHPMPDLQIQGDLVELPFWIYRLGEPRQRLFVRVQNGGGIAVLFNNQTISLPPISRGEAAWNLALEFQESLASRQLVIRPRALTLTMFTRLFLADLFIHGIGGALYDQITDAILTKQFGLALPYACVSAAWLLPLGQAEETAPDLGRLAHERHHLFHNPQAAIDPFTALRTDYAELIAERRKLLEATRESLATDRRAGRAERREWFHRLHAVNAALHEKSPRLLAKIDESIAAAKIAAEQNKVLLWREFYFGLHTMESLRTLIDRVRAS
jgi:hypothetical protein